MCFFPDELQIPVFLTHFTYSNQQQQEVNQLKNHKICSDALGSSERLYVGKYLTEHKRVENDCVQNQVSI